MQGPAEIPDLTLAVMGSNFVLESKVRWNGSDMYTSFLSSTELTARLPGAFFKTPGEAVVTVFTPPPGGGESNAVTFPITSAVPTITSIFPSSVVAGSAGFWMTITGVGFNQTSVAHWNGSPLLISYTRTSTQIDVNISETQVAVPGTAAVTVVTPPPGGGTSNAMSFDILPSEPLRITTSALPTTAPGTFFDFTLSAAGGVPYPLLTPPTYRWSFVPETAPAGLSIHVGTGRIFGTVSGSGASFTVRVRDYASTPNVAVRDFTISVDPSLARNDFCTPGSEAGTTRISNGTLRASFSPYGDVDVYSFQGTAGAEVTIETFAQRLNLPDNPSERDSQADTIAELLDGNCSQLTYNDDASPPPNHLQDSLINFTLPASGLYFIRVRDFRSDGRPDLIYDLSLSGAD